VGWDGWELGRAGLTFQYITILTVHILFECQYSDFTFRQGSGRCAVKRPSARKLNRESCGAMNEMRGVITRAF
jgi:hypothetical protein